MIVSATHTVFVARPPDVVWNYTQDPARRAEWDPSIVHAHALPSDALPRVRIRAVGGMEGTLEYLLYDAPHRTSVSMADVRSPLLSGGGGSWSYTARDRGTEWTATNSLRFRNVVLYWILGWIVRHALRRDTVRGLESVRTRLEKP